jgi:serine/threonine protein kinase
MPAAVQSLIMPSKAAHIGHPFVRNGRTFLKGVVPRGDNRGHTFTIAQPLGGRYQIVRFFASGGMGLLLEGIDRRTDVPVIVKTNLRYQTLPYARVADREGFTQQLLLPRKTLEMERRILVLMRNAGCNAVPHPNDFVYDVNPQLEGPYTTEDGQSWTYDDKAMIDSEPYLVMERVPGVSLEQTLHQAPGNALSESRALRIFMQVAEILHTLHQPKPMRPGMTWQLVYQDLKPANVLLSVQDRVTLLDLGGCQLQNADTRRKLLPGAATAGYCPPECERPYELLTPASDIYTVGVNLFQTLSGRSPLEFFGGLAMVQPRSVRLDLRVLQEKCRPAVADIVRRCVEPEPAHRFSDALALFRALDHALQAT